MVSTPHAAEFHLPPGSGLESMVATANLSPPGQVLDLGGKVLKSKLDMPLTLCPQHPITIRNGTLRLCGEQRLLVRGPHAVRLEGVTVLGPGAPAAGHTMACWWSLKGLLQVTGRGSSLHLAGCTLRGGAHDAVLVADKGGRLEMSGACVVSGHPAGSGCIVRGGDSHLEAEGCTVEGHAGSGVWVSVGGGAGLTCCQLTGMGLHCLYVDNGKAVARQCSMASNGLCGVIVWSGGAVELTGCHLTKNKARIIIIRRRRIRIIISH